MTLNKKEIVNAFNTDFSKQIAVKSNYGKLTSNDMFYIKEQADAIKRDFDEIEAELSEENVVQKLLKRIEKLESELEIYKQSEQEAGEIIAELKHENEQLKDVACDAIIEQERLIKQVNTYRTALEETRKILSISELPPVDEDNLMTATELMVEVSLKREEKLNKIQDKVDEVLK